MFNVVTLILEIGVFGWYKKKIYIYMYIYICVCIKKPFTQASFHITPQKARMSEHSFLVVPGDLVSISFVGL